VQLEETDRDQSEDPVQQRQKVELAGAGGTLGLPAVQAPDHLLKRSQQGGGGLVQQFNRQIEMYPGAL
jgi:hypothetical protein